MVSQPSASNNGTRKANLDQLDNQTLHLVTIVVHTGVKIILALALATSILNVVIIWPTNQPWFLIQMAIRPLLLWLGTALFLEGALKLTTTIIRRWQQ